MFTVGYPDQILKLFLELSVVVLEELLVEKESLNAWLLWCRLLHTHEGIALTCPFIFERHQIHFFASISSKHEAQVSDTLFEFISDRYICRR